MELARLSPRHLVRRFTPGMIDRPGFGIRPFRRGNRAPWRANQHLAALGHIGDLEVRLARTAAEVRRSQALRYNVFYEEMSAIASPEAELIRRDVDPFDLICDHLLVVDQSAPKRPFMRNKAGIVGTYRMLRQEIAEANGGFYTAGEYDISPLLERHDHLNFLELGRSCVLKPYRDKRTVELLWHGIWAYVLMHGVDVMIGCASLEGTDPDKLALPLSFLHHNARPPEAWDVRAHDHLYVDMNRMPAEAIDMKQAMRALPPLIKGYLRIGAYIGDGAVVDHQFGTTDVMIIMPVSAMNARYVNYYGGGNGRYAS
ncbi:ornithine-acyl[acyl carrier protein] N-acyltransferase [Faunimonas pinastri]|uniref:L-ornithine N(alpha)-acyltransferase n=1 Tax=Faunimonas pinastri TaxID=1855383 RepID=A0A1H9GXT1_9HYPH|nr:GNAT family N-acyltransferase [Faunimonas pinastri]SEQ54845.1 ornithine-acyl[acyl carrier protein] N-acyltransferase [Faunimonas pinastri]